MLALSTSCGDPDRDLHAVVESFRDLGVQAVALHRPARADEARRLAALARRVRIVAVFGDEPGADVGAPILVVEGGPAGADRERSLEDLCRRLHALRADGRRVALRTPPGPDHHPAPGEIALVAEAVRFVGYWHDATRGGDGYLDAASRALLGASFHPLAGADLVGLRDALPRRAPAVVTCPPDEIREAIRCARGVFRV